MKVKRVDLENLLVCLDHEGVETLEVSEEGEFAPCLHFTYQDRKGIDVQYYIHYITEKGTASKAMVETTVTAEEFLAKLLKGTRKGR